MAQTIIWTEQSLEDIERVAEYIGRDSIYYANRVVEKIYEAGESIPEHPKLGRIVPEFGQDRIRERFVYSYRILYEISAKEIQILGVIQGNRLLENIDHSSTHIEN